MSKRVQKTQYLLRLLANPKLYNLLGSPFEDPLKLDSLLSTVCYGSLFISELIKRRPELVQILSNLAEKLKMQGLISLIKTLIQKIQRAVDPKHRFSINVSLDSLSTKLRLISDYIADVRIFNRMWGLPGLLAFGLEDLHRIFRADSNFITKLLEATSTISIVAYQPLENVAFAADHNWTHLEKSASLEYYVASSRLWAVFVVLEVVKLVKTMIQTKLAGKPLDLLHNRSLNRSLVANIANLPLTVHWSLYDGCLSDLTVGFLGTMSSLFDTIDSWGEVSAQLRQL
ncbi:hypothetical protein KL905_001712 [Ogataea polymorpha]|uniref:Uncharacterized protein n=2 Tax=Ogataea TaxID=461281 RepID=A0A9P8P439_9ASCO|nr:hypothetical protein KL937_000183 [Ogataea polymorpha]KAG7889555.1 hypothetical protein KL908_004668 [Ogataea polymorpha]KAG7904228.1 hypothetical protein KL935_000367 [Ogataea polymorpha]KAG7905837.1 hypothetical protein KL906_004907 [Ogataea polymorpha]KAG7908271.1 hypothetical protein KL907_001761 [Ogataea polymorpha]